MKTWIIRMLITYVLKNYRTTIPGFIGLVLNIFPGVAPWIIEHGYSMDAVNGVLLAIVAFFAKDGGVSNAPEPLDQPATVFAPNTDTDRPVGG